MITKIMFLIFIALAGFNLGNAYYYKENPIWMRIISLSAGFFCLGSAVLKLIELCHG